ncbi:MAG: cytochrome c3 family protein [Sphingosinicella sp.]
MAFLLRTISYSAEGRRIVRESRVEGESLRVGRGPENDLRLADLAVMLDHATLTGAGDGLQVEASAGAVVEIGGRAVSSGRIDLATGGTLRVGPFRLAVSPGGGEDVAIEIERPEARAPASGGERLLSLAAVLPSRRRFAWALGLLVLALFLAWPVSTYVMRAQQRAEFARAFQADRLWLSGSLSQAHASLRDNCAACHAQAFVPVQDAACLACHAGLDEHAPATQLARARADPGAWRRVQLAFGDLFGHAAGRCVDCHSEHEGAQAMAPTPQRFCADCHADLDARLAGSRLGDAGDFGRAHPEFAPLVIVRWDGERPLLQRLGLAARPQESSQLKFPHSLHFDPRGGPAQMARRLNLGARLECSVCHLPDADGVRFPPPVMENACGACHSLAIEQVGGTVRTLRHGEPQLVVANILALYRAGSRPRPAGLARGRGRPGTAFAERGAGQAARASAAAPLRADQAVRAVFSPGGACFECHTVRTPAAGSLDFRIAPVAFPRRYLLHGWFDHRPHRVVQLPGRPPLQGSQACLACHRADTSGSAGDLLLPGIASCRACHGGERTRLPVASGCAMCHDYHGDEGAPAMLLLRQARGASWTTRLIRAEPERGR